MVVVFFGLLLVVYSERKNHVVLMFLQVSAGCKWVKISLYRSNGAWV